MNKHVTPPRRKNQGFTLIEMLIVVAIIAILVAVSIPIVGNSLERARVATDAANERAAKAEAIILYIGDKTSGAFSSSSGTLTGYYDAVNGQIKSGTDGITPYGKCTTTGFAHKGGVIKVEITEATGVVKISWEGTTGSSGVQSKAHDGVVIS